MTMSTPALPAAPPQPPASPDTRVTHAHPDGAPGEDLDLEEDVAPNLGGEDQMQDA
jgi:hypothetical protein